MGLPEAIIKTLNKKIAEAPFDKTMVGIIESIEGGVYSVRVEDGKYKIRASSSFNIGNTVKVCFPRNSKMNPFIVGDGAGSTDVDLSEYVRRDELEEMLTKINDALDGI